MEDRDVNLFNPRHYRIEGGSDESYFKIYDTIFEDYNINPNNIIEIGFNAGYSAIYFLEKFKNCNVVSLDLNLHEYCFSSKLFIDYHHPGRHLYIGGDSYVQLDSLSNFYSKKVDLIFIDGGHDLETAYYDIIKSSYFTTIDTYLILDNTSPHKGHGIGPYIAMNKSIREGRLQFIKYYSVGQEGFCLLKFSNQISNPIDYRFIEKDLALWRLDNLANIFIKREDPDGKNYALMCIIVEKFVKLNIPIDPVTLEKLKHRVGIPKNLISRIKIRE